MILSRVFAPLVQFFLALTICHVTTAHAVIVYPDFDHSMVRQGLDLVRIHSGFDAAAAEHYRNRNQEMTAFFRNLYYRNIAEAAREERKLRIPRIVHQIWLGSEVPHRFYDWMQSWQNLEGWEYKLWTDKEVDEIFLYNRTLYEQSTNYGEKADIVRLEILAQFGGIYVDVDFECLKPEIFEELHHAYDFYIGFEPLEHGYTHKFNMFKVCNALMASAAENPLLQDLIVNLRANYFAHYYCCSAVQRTGPSYLMRIICEHERSGTTNCRNMYLPCTFFYPVSEPEMCYFFEHPELSAVIMPETAGIHYWCGTWWKNNPFFKSLEFVEGFYPYQSR